MNRRIAQPLLFPVLVLAGFWLLSQLTVATWLAREANQRQADWAQGLSPWRWDFSQPAAVVRPGSHGLDAARGTRDGLDITLPEDGIANLSLALRGERIDTRAVSRVRMELEAGAPARLMLLAGSTGPPSVWLDATVDPGPTALELALQPFDAAPGASRAPPDGLFLRIESAPGTRLTLQALALRAAPCAGSGCPGQPHAAPFFTMPERLLAWRDARLVEHPAAAIEAAGWLGSAARALARLTPELPQAFWRILTLPLALLVLFALARRRAARTQTPAPASRPLAELAIGLGLPLALLLAGWPARETPLAITISFAACVLALALFPAPDPPRWRGSGDRNAWRAALVFTLAAGLLLAPLGGLDDSASAPRDSARFLRYPLWALVQQWLLLVAIAPRLHHLIPDARLAALACGVAFGLLHAPNFALMAFTFAGGTVWAWLGWRHRALLPLAASHAALGLWLTHIAPTWLLRSAEIGGRYLMAP